VAKNKFYFSHDGGARNDDKMIAVRMKHKAEGYAVYFMILEKMLESSDYILLKDYNVLAFDFRVGSDLVKSIVEDFGLFEFTEDNKSFYSKSFKARMEPLENIKETYRIKGIRGSLIKRKIITKEESLKLSDNQVIELNSNLSNKPNLSTTLAELKPSLSKKQQNRIEDNIVNTSSNEEVKKPTNTREENFEEENSEIQNSTFKNFQKEKEKSSAKKEKELESVKNYLVENGADYADVSEWFRKRIEERKATTRYYAEKFILECKKNNISVKEGAFACAFNGWVNFNPQWVINQKESKSKSSKNGKPESPSPNKVGRVDVDKAGEFLERRRKERELQSAQRA